MTWPKSLIKPEPGKPKTNGISNNEQGTPNIEGNPPHFDIPCSIFVIRYSKIKKV
jgi:hypothetical protein